MAINKFGAYVSPLTEEERVKIFGLVKDKIEAKIVSEIASNLRATSGNTYHITRSCFEITDETGMTEEINRRFKMAFDILKSDFPDVTELWDESNYKYTVSFNDDGIPKLNMAPWLEAIIKGNGSVTLELSLVREYMLIKTWREWADSNPEVYKENIAPDFQPIIEWNKEFNEVTDYSAYDFTDVIQELIQAVKDGKL